MPLSLCSCRRLLLLVVGVAWGWVACAAPGDASVVTLTEAQSLSMPARTAVPPLTGAYAPVSLPDEWLSAAPALPDETAHAQAVWYRLPFDLPPAASGQVLAVYLPRACSNLEIFVNGRLLYRGGRMTEPITSNCYSGHLVALPPQLLQTAGNQLDIQVVGQPIQRVSARQRAGGLSEVQIGPYATLSSAYEQQRFWNVTLVQTIAMALLMIGAIMLALGWMRRLSYLSYFGVIAIGWAMLSARLWVRDVGLAQEVYELLISMAFVPLGVCGVLMVLRYCEVHRPRLDLALWAQCVVLPVLVALAGPDRLFVASTLVYCLLALQGVLAIGYLSAHVWRSHRHDFWLICVLFVNAALVLTVELAIQLRMLPMPHVHLIHLAIPVLIAALAFRLVQTFSRALDSAEQTRMHLEQRVKEISAQIERNLSQQAEMRVEQVAEKERKRIAADLHDDLGAKLLTIVHTSDNERISTLAREALEEMRLSVRGIAGKPVQLADALADWRAETVLRLGEAGIEIEWTGTEPPTSRTLAARSYVQTTRVLREATSNLIKHSGASRAIVSCTIGDEFQLVIRDNGRGIPLELDGRLDRGHGMASMKHRAKQLHGQCLVESGPGYGTVIRLTLPL